MKLRTGRSIYRIPPYSQIIYVHIRGNHPHNQMVDYVLHQIDLGDMAELGRKERRKAPREIGRAHV